MAQGQRKYEKEYKVQAVKLAKEIGAGKAAKELGIPVDTLYGWQKAVREGRLDAGPGSRGPGEAMSLAEELGALHKQIKALERENRRLRACLKSPPRMSWRRIFRPDCVKNPCHPSGCLRIFALQGKKSSRQSIHVEILNRL